MRAALNPGDRLGPYDITAQIRKGGMGEVYRATDSNLGRQVAIKVLPEVFAQDAERLARFEREAKTLASLNHPNIATIHGLERSDGLRALVMELIDGPTLADRIAQGPIPIDEALPIAKQIADALEAAHDKGIVHRDLKPSNIALTSDDRVKVLDFGLAKLAPQARGGGAAASLSPTITSPALVTGAGVLLGTAAYMAPEQAKGREADRRSDVWAFGCVLFEMLTGSRAFHGEDVADTLAGILTREPNWGELPRSTPPALRRLLRRCLTKPRDARLSDAGSLRLEIEDARAELAETPLPAQVHSRRRLIRDPLWLAAAVALALAAALLAWMVKPGVDGVASMRGVLLPVAPADRLLSGFRLDPTSGLGRPSRTALTFSPDGRTLVYSAEREGLVQLYRHRMDGTEPVPIRGTEGASDPFFSPDGQWIGFHADGWIRKVPVDGGPAEPIHEVNVLFGAAWNDRNEIVFGSDIGARSGLWRVSAESGGKAREATMLLEGEMRHRLPRFLPDGDKILFTVTRSVFPRWDETLIVVQSLATGERKELFTGADARYIAATGHIAFLRRGTLMAARFDADTLEHGQPVALVSGIMQAASVEPLQIDTGAGQFAVSETGTFVYVPGGVFPQERWALGWVEASSGMFEPLAGLSPGAYAAPRISPDGTRAAFNTTAAEWDLWTYDLTAGTGRLFLKNPDSLAAPDELASGLGSGNTLPNAWHPHDGTLAFTQDRAIWLLKQSSPSKPVETEITGAAVDFSPSGDFMAYSTAAGAAVRGQVMVTPYPGHSTHVPIGDGCCPIWDRRGGLLYYMRSVQGRQFTIQVVAVPIATEPTLRATGPGKSLFEGPFRNDGPFRNYDVNHDGSRFLMIRQVLPSEAITHIVVDQNWFEILNRATDD